MASTVILPNVYLFWVKCDPDHPADAFEEGKPQRWEAQLRWDLDNKQVNDIVKGAGLKAKAVVDDQKAEAPYMKLQVYKPIVNSKKEPLKPVVVVSGTLSPIDPNTVGNGSIGNVRLHVYDYEVRNKGKVTKSGTTSMLMGIQVTSHRIYKRDNNDFAPASYSVTNPEAIPTEGEIDEDDDGNDVTNGSTDPRF